jgi:hypothetical protein
VIRFPIVVVEWVDSTSFGGWRHHDEAMEIIATPDRLNITSVGYLFHECEHHVTLVQSSGHSQVGEGITIPRSAITSMKRISEG